MIIFKALKPIRAITFDLDDTLYNNMPYIYAAEASLREYILKQYPVTKAISKERWQTIRLDVLKASPELFNDIGELRKTTLRNGFRQAKMQESLIDEAAEDCFDHFFKQRSAFKVSPDVIATLKTLSEKVPLAAITNGNADCEAIGIADCFTHIVQASPQYPMKPHRGMFDLVAQALSVAPEHMLHVGDDLDKDIKGAIYAGYQAAWVAVNRPMLMNKEPSAGVLPHIQLNNIHQLKQLV